MSMFTRFRQLRRLLALVALVWLPLSVYAQVCTTQMAVMAIGGMHHPGLPQPGDHGISPLPSDRDSAVTVVVDAETFWRTVDSMDSACDMKALCAFAGLAALTSSVDSLAPPLQIAEMAVPVDNRFTSLITQPDTPPPRRAL
jgi:hypothetical protein